MTNLIPTAVAAVTSLLLVTAFALRAAAPLPGGFTAVSPADEQVVTAAKSAVAARDATLTLQAIVEAERQVVAGLNYRLTLKVADNGASRLAEAIVWHKLDGQYALTSWKSLGDAPAQAGLLMLEFIFESAPFPSCHASTIVEAKAGGLVAAWFGGRHEKAPDVGIWVSRLAGGKWTAPVEVANGMQPDGTRHPCWNPVLFQPKRGPLLLFYKVGPSPGAWWGMLRTSSDNGKSWSDARRLPDGILGPIKNKPVQLPNGDILCPTSSEHAGWRVHFERSTDDGATWTATAPVNDGKVIGAIQPSILFLGGDNLMAVGRTRQGRIFRINSDDAGRTWGPMRLTTLPNPNAGTDAVTLRDGRQLLVYNQSTGGRSPLNVAVSKDGKTWQAALVLENEPKMEFSYPAVIQTGDGLVHITYTWKRQRVKHVMIDPGKLELKTIAKGEWPK
jgi:predicted neuraminidase